VQFNSGNNSGPVSKSVTVSSNDKRQPSLGELQSSDIVTHLRQGIPHEVDRQGQSVWIP